MNATFTSRTSDDRASLVRRGRYLEYFTIAYNSLEGIIAIGAGLVAGSIALFGIVLAAVSVVVMPLLVRAKRKVARGITSGGTNG